MYNTNKRSFEDKFISVILGFSDACCKKVIWICIYRSKMAANDKEVLTVPSLWEDLWKSYEYLNTTDEPTVSDKFQVLI